MSEDLMPTVIAVLIVIFMMFIKDRYGGTKTFDNEAERWVSRAVHAAEQMFPGEGRGEEKYDWVMNFVKTLYPKLDAMRLRVLIEYAVKMMKGN
jgi:hypothetical protein